MHAEENPDHTRRAFIGGAAVLGAASAADLYLPTLSDAKRRKRRYREHRRVDLHAHHLPASYVQALHDAGIFLIGGIPIPQWSPERALTFMKHYGIAYQMLSISDPGVSFVDGPKAIALARKVNQDAAAVIRAHSKHFGAFSVLPMPDVAASLAEIRYSLGTLKLNGVGLLSSYGGKYLGDPAFRPVLSDLNKRHAWVFVHPTAVAADDRPDYQIPNFVTEYPFDTTRTITSLLFNGIFHDYPHIRWQFAHGGGTIPMLRFRLRALAGSAKQFGPALGLPSGSRKLTAKSADRALRRVYYDTALVADRPALEAVSHLTSSRHIVFGSDWPFAERLYTKKGDPQPALSKAFSNDQRRGIDRLNARREFRRVAKVVPD